jgi:hypothetical protein
MVKLDIISASEAGVSGSIPDGQTNQARLGHESKQQQPAGEMDEWFKSHAWKACVGS